MSTITHLTGYPDDGPLFTGTTFGDPLAGLMGAVGDGRRAQPPPAHGRGPVHRPQPGRGVDRVRRRDVDRGPARRGTDPGRIGNASRTARAARELPVRRRSMDRHRLSPTTPTGPPLGRARPRPAPVPDGRRAPRRPRRRSTRSSRRRRRDATRSTLMHRLQAVGVAASVVMNGRDLLADEHLAELVPGSRSGRARRAAPPRSGLPLPRRHGCPPRGGRRTSASTTRRSSAASSASRRRSSRRCAAMTSSDMPRSASTSHAPRSRWR